MRIIRKQNHQTRNNTGNKPGNKPDHMGNSPYSRNQFCARIYGIYNKIPSIITSIEQPHIFKKYLKSYLMDNNNLPDPAFYKINGLQNGI